MIRLTRYPTRSSGVNATPVAPYPLFTGYIQHEGGGTELPVARFTFDPSHLEYLGTLTLVTYIASSDGIATTTLQLVNRNGAPTDITSSVLTTTNNSLTALSASLTLGTASDEFSRDAGEYELEVSTSGAAGVYALLGRTYLLISP